MITENEKNIYNSYLRVSKQQQDKPYTLRKNFKGFEDTEKYVYVSRIAKLLAKYNYIQYDDYFRAPYELYPDEVSYIDLQFYSTIKGLKAYNELMTKRQNEEPDSDHNIEGIKKSLKFIYEFCTTNDVQIKQYAQYQDNDDLYHSFVHHLREHRINMYVLFGFEDFERVLKKWDKEELYFSTSILREVPRFRTRYMASKRAKKIIQQGIEKLAIRQLKTADSKL